MHHLNKRMEFVRRRSAHHKRKYLQHHSCRATQTAAQGTLQSTYEIELTRGVRRGKVWKDNTRTSVSPASMKPFIKRDIPSRTNAREAT